MSMIPDRIEPLSNVRAFWDHNLGGYPERVRLAMSDGSIQTFWYEPDQPKPQTAYVPKHGKTGGAATPTGLRKENN